MELNQLMASVQTDRDTHLFHVLGVPSDVFGGQVSQMHCLHTNTNSAANWLRIQFRLLGVCDRRGRAATLWHPFKDGPSFFCMISTMAPQHSTQAAAA